MSLTLALLQVKAMLWRKLLRLLYFDER